MAYELTASVHKGTCSSSSIAHNRRTIAVPHACKEKECLNIRYVDMDLEEAYHKLFDKALEEYNAGKKPSRRISDYLKHITEQYEKGEQKLQEAKSRGASTKELAMIKSRYPKPYYELIVSIGNCDAYGGAFKNGGKCDELSLAILDEFMNDFSRRNPNLFVFNAICHRDELNGVPHIHISYIPWTNEKGRGLPVRVSENGAFKQQGLTTGERGDSGTIAFQFQERQTLSEIARKHQITIIQGKYKTPKKHLEKEEYILRQEQEKAKADHQLISGQADELIRYQDEFINYLRSNGIEESFSEHIENLSLKQDVIDYKQLKDQNKKILAECWQDYNSFTSSFFTAYRENKKMLWEEIKKARETSHLNKKRLEDLIYDITDGSDFFIVKIFKLFIALFMAIGNIHYDNEIEKLQLANKSLKESARKVMNQSNDVSAILRSRQLESIEQALTEYETVLESAKSFIENTTRQLGLIAIQETSR